MHFGWWWCCCWVYWWVLCCWWLWGELWSCVMPLMMMQEQDHDLRKQLSVIYKFRGSKGSITYIALHIELLSAHGVNPPRGWANLNTRRCNR